MRSTISAILCLTALLAIRNLAFPFTLAAQETVSFSLLDEIEWLDGETPTALSPIHQTGYETVPFAQVVRC